jgi:hypothetical protein
VELPQLGSSNISWMDGTLSKYFAPVQPPKSTSLPRGFWYVKSFPFWTERQEGLLFGPSRFSLCSPIIDGSLAASRTLPKRAPEQAAVTRLLSDQKQNTPFLLKECSLFQHVACRLVKVHHICKKGTVPIFKVQVWVEQEDKQVASNKQTGSTIVPWRWKQYVPP